jgi:uncharacterized repeat protein (TIGR02543 family)
MKNLLSARLLALITVPVLISGLVLPTAATAAPLPTIESATITGTVGAGQTLTAHANGVSGGKTTTYFNWYVANDTANTLYGDSGFTFAYDGQNDGSSTFTIPDNTWWYGKEVWVVITVSNCETGILVDPNYPEYGTYDEDPITCVATAGSQRYVIPYQANLFDLALSSGTLSTTFNSATTSYTASVSNATTSITVTPSTGTVIPFVDPNDRNATTQVRVNGGVYATVLSGESSTALSLNVGANPIDVKVTAQDGTTTKTYTVTVTRAAASAPPINVIFNANNGTGGWKNQFITAGKATPLLSNTYTRTGYTPNGWNTQADGNGTPYTDGQSVTLALNSGLTLFAKWTANPNTVTFNANGAGTSGIMDNQSISSGAATALTANTFTRTGYTFAGWATNSNGSGTTYSNSQSVTLTSGLNLFARWNAKTNTVFFNSNYGSGNRISQDIISDRATALRANSFTRTGYAFAGWNTQADGNGVSYANNVPVTITSGLNLFAKWTKN